MRRIAMKRSLSFVIATLTLVILFTSNSYSQYGPQDKPKEYVIPVSEDAKQNGYKIYNEGNISYFGIVNIVEPKTLEVANGKVKMKYFCSQHKKKEKIDKSDKTLETREVVLTGGSSEKTPSPCTNIDQPYLQVHFIIALEGVFPSRK